MTTRRITLMPLRKTAIAISDELLSAVDRAARARGETRNRFVTRVLQEAVRARRDAEVTRRLNELFAEPEIAQEQTRSAGELDTVGTPWNDERW
jgi:metal-responsive CopG/Arc/MetJ family transcriptional regulator